MNKIKSWVVVGVGVDELEGKSWSTEDGAWAAYGRHCSAQGWVDSDWRVVGQESADGVEVPQHVAGAEVSPESYSAGYRIGLAVAEMARAWATTGAGLQAGMEQARRDAAAAERGEG